MLQIRLSKPSNVGSGGAKPLPAETVTVACPDHLVLADLPVAKGIGGATAASLIKSVSRKSRRQLGERVHFCVRCDFPIAVYGRLSPCEHAFCLDCARSDSICYLCDERIQKIQTIKIMEGIFICAAPHCLKSFLKRTEFESHIHESHADLLQPNREKEDGNESEAQSAKQSTSDSTVRGPQRPFFSLNSNSQLQDLEDKALHQQPQPKQPPLFGQVQNNQSEPQQGSHSRINQQNFDPQGTPHRESIQYPDKQPGILSDNLFPEYPPMHSIQAPNYTVPLNSNTMMTPPLPFGYPPFPVEAAQPFFGAPYEIAHQDSAPIGSDQGSLLGFPPGPNPGMNFSSNYRQPWNIGQVGAPFEPPGSGGQGISDGFATMPDSQGKVGFYPPLVNKGMEQTQGGNDANVRDGKGVFAAQPMHLPPPPPPLNHALQQKRGNFYSGEGGRDGQGFGWQHENRDGFGSG